MEFHDWQNKHSFEELIVNVGKVSDTNDLLQESVFQDIKNLNFGDTLCLDPSDEINFNEGREADPFDKLAKYYGRKKDVFFFISVLRSEQCMRTINDILDTKCDTNSTKENFLKRMSIYLCRIDKGEICAREVVKADGVTAFFNEYSDNLNINCKKSQQTFNIDDIFNNPKSINLKRIKIYENGRRAVTILNQLNETYFYSFGKSSVCQFIINRMAESNRLALILSMKFGKVEVVNFKMNDVDEIPSKALKNEGFNDPIFIGAKSLYETLVKYFRKNGIATVSINNAEQCLPIKTLDDLKCWIPPSVKHATQTLLPRLSLDDQPKTLLCHDMKGGYLMDRFLNGVRSEDEYYFIHWAAIDTFVYFSHHLVTIPPCAWISAAHRNGVKVLGTFITEWDDGAKVCEDFLKDEKSIHDLSLQLTNIATHYSFDGWLINIENKLQICQIPLLEQFVKCLTDTMHKACPSSQIIWYDSVIESGDLKWQNALNEQNRIFFDACDGIFLNYNWKKEHLLKSIEVAGERKADVYVGVDVFGRGCLGGGGMNTHVAVSAAREFSLSVAIFAPGWIHECLDVKDFKQNQFKFWESLQELCECKKLKDLPFYSSFCPGFGKKMSRNGKIISSEPWYNLSIQQIQPMFNSQCVPQGCTLQTSDKKAYNGGGSLWLHGRHKEIIGQDLKPLDFKILSTEFMLQGPCFVSYTFQNKSRSSEVSLAFHMSSAGEKYKLYFVDTEGESPGPFNSSERFIQTTTQRVISEGGFPIEEFPSPETNWTKRMFFLNCVDHAIEGIDIRIQSLRDHKYSSDSAAFDVYLGSLKIMPLPSKPSILDLPSHTEKSSKFTQFNVSCNQSETDVNIANFQCDLRWHNDSSIHFCDLYVEADNLKRQYICTTSQSFYWLDLNITFVPDITIVICRYGPLGNPVGHEHIIIPLKY